MAKSVKVHDDTHAALKDLKASKRSKSIDEVIRGLIKEGTGTKVGRPKRGEEPLTAYTSD